MLVTYFMRRYDTYPVLHVRVLMSTAAACALARRNCTSGCRVVFALYFVVLICFSIHLFDWSQVCLQSSLCTVDRRVDVDSVRYLASCEA